MPKGTANTELIKKPYSKTPYTPEEMEELTLCLDPKTGPIYFMQNFMKIQHPTKGEMAFEPFNFQNFLVDNYHQYRFSINMLPRQTGKTTCAAGYLLWYAMFVPDSTILIAAHKHTGSSEIMTRVRYAYEGVPNHIRAGVVEYNKGSVQFDNGSRIVATTTTENTGRGMSLSLIYLDEFAFVPPRIAKEFWTSLSPTLATGGKCIITSTPNSDDDTFANIWSQACNTLDHKGDEQELGTNGFKAFKVHWKEHPDRNDEWAAEERGRIGEERFRREHECEFIIYDETLIDSLVLIDMKGIDPIERMGQVRWYKKPNKDSIYCIALDPSTGTGGDFAAITVFELPSMEQVAEWQNNKAPIEQQMKTMRQILTEIRDTGCDEIYWTVENNAIGEAALVVIRETGEEKFPGMFCSEPKRAPGPRKSRKGFHTTNRNKVETCLEVKRWIESSKLKIKSKNLVRELKTFVSRGNSFSAKPGETDDLVMSMIINARLIKYVATFDEGVYDSVTLSLGDYDDDEGGDEALPILML
jgi:hypothetical protein